jgi:hypothetical protein
LSSSFSISPFNLITGILKFLARQAAALCSMFTYARCMGRQTDHCPWGQRGRVTAGSNWFLCAYDASKDVFPVNIPAGRQRMGWPITNRDAVFNGVLTYKKSSLFFCFQSADPTPSQASCFSYNLLLHFEWGEKWKEEWERRVYSWGKNITQLNAISVKHRY